MVTERLLLLIKGKQLLILELTNDHGVNECDRVAQHGLLFAMMILVRNTDISKRCNTQIITAPGVLMKVFT